jgi:hypothetical protein
MPVLLPTAKAFLPFLANAQKSESYEGPMPTLSPAISCPKLPEFNPRDAHSVEEAFAGAAVMTLGQAWREKPQPDFRPGTVQVGWREDRLWVSANLVDDVPMSSAMAHNEHLWELGDVFEMFLQDLTLPGYAEFHAAPNGRRLQLIFPEEDTFARISREELELAQLFKAERLFDYAVTLHPGGWNVLASIPSQVFADVASLAGRSWKVSFSRYDYSQVGGQPVLSSTSPHKILSFHRREDWTVLTFID